MKVLTLNLKGVYFDQIVAGEKDREFREVKPVWTKRLEGREYHVIEICRGYPAKDDHANRRVFEYMGFEIRTIKHEHFGPDPVKVYAIRLTHPIQPWTDRSDDE